MKFDDLIDRIRRFVSEVRTVTEKLREIGSSETECRLSQAFPYELRVRSERCIQEGSDLISFCLVCREYPYLIDDEIPFELASLPPATREEYYMRHELTRSLPDTIARIDYIRRIVISDFTYLRGKQNR